MGTLRGSTDIEAAIAAVIEGEGRFLENLYRTHPYGRVSRNRAMWVDAYDRAFAPYGVPGEQALRLGGQKIGLLAFALRGTRIEIPCWHRDSEGEPADYIITREDLVLCTRHYQAIPPDSYWRKERGGSEGNLVGRDASGVWQEMACHDGPDGRPVLYVHSEPWWADSRRRFEQILGQPRRQYEMRS